MRLRFGIMMKLFFWYSLVLSISFGMIIFFYAYAQGIMKVSDDIVNKKYIISSNAKKMIDSLLYMEENERKYDVLKKNEYMKYFVSAQSEFDANLTGVIRLEWGTDDCAVWEDLYQDFRAQLPTQPPAQISSSQAEEQPGEDGQPVPWIPEGVLNDWIHRISVARAENERQVVAAMQELHSRGQTAVSRGLAALSFAGIVGAVGVAFLTFSISRPLSELRKGIRSLSREGPVKPIRVVSKDEFGDLAQTFNEMAARLEEEDRLRSDFIAMLSHEIRTPLTSIRESVNLIGEEVMGPINERQSRFLGIASLELDRISNLLNHLMQVSRIEVGAMKIVPRPMDPSILVSGSAHRLAPAAEAKNMRIETVMPESIPLVMGDTEHLQQVLLNLVGNAIKFSPPGGEVVVRIEPDSEKGRVRFSVSDSGPGISEEESQLIFHKYYRAAGIRNQVDGVGLGLSISKYIVEAHGGSIWVESAMGKGASFGFSIPVAPEG